MPIDGEPIHFEEEYNSRYKFRHRREAQRLQELSAVIPWDRKEELRFFGQMFFSSQNDTLYALKQSIVVFWAEAQDCFVHGTFQACIMMCGAVVERCLKYEYQKAKGQIPASSKWTFGRLINHWC